MPQLDWATSGMIIFLLHAWFWGSYIFFYIADSYTLHKQVTAIYGKFYIGAIAMVIVLSVMDAHIRETAEREAAEKAKNVESEKYVLWEDIQ